MTPRMTSPLILAVTLVFTAAGTAFLARRPAAPPADPVPSPPAGPQVASPTHRPNPNALLQTAWDKAQSRIRRADAVIDAALQRALDELRTFFDDRKGGAGAFAEDALSWSSTWQLTKSYVPYCDGDAHKRYLEESFRRNIFTDDDIRQAVERAVRAALNGAIDADNRLLIDLRADLDDLPADVLPAAKDLATFRRAFDDCLRGVAREVGTSVAVETASFASSTVIMEVTTAVVARVLTAVGTRLATRSGLLAAGAGGSTVTFGASLVAAVVIDYVLGKIIGLFYDPQERIVAKVHDCLDESVKLLIAGDQETAGLRDELTRLLGKRQRIRDEALRRLILDHAP